MRADHGCVAIPLMKTVGGQFLVESEINGVQAMLILYTGAFTTIVDSAAQKQFSLPELYTTSIPVFGFTAPGSVAMSRVGSFVIGPLRFKNRPVFLMDLRQITKIIDATSSQRVSGILGQDVLETHEAIIDYKSRLLYLMAE
jgi:predicted aspartyl protease